MKNEKLNKYFAYPAIFDLRHEETFATHRGLTKLELISAMCLQGLLGNQEFSGSHPVSIASYSIVFAKELLKQLEEIQEDTNK